MMSESPLQIDQFLENIQQKLGIKFVPNIFNELKAHPRELMNIWHLVEATLLDGKIHRMIKEMVFVVTANEKNCRYCSIAHKAMALELGVSKTLLDCIDGNFNQVAPDSLKWTLHYAQALSASNLDKAQQYRQLMISEGSTEQEVNEITMMVSTATLMSTLANGMSLNNNVDQEFLDTLSAVQ